MTLVEQQLLFARLLPELLAYADRCGIRIAMGECWRSPAEAQRLRDAGLGSLNSLHCSRLAVDLLCFQQVGGTWEYLSDGKAPEYAILGNYWMTLHDLCRWGGTFSPKPDYDHYSLAWQGRE